MTGTRATNWSVVLSVAIRLVCDCKTKVTLSTTGSWSFHHPAAPASSEASWLETPSRGVEQHRVSVDVSLQVTQTYSLTTLAATLVPNKPLKLLVNKHGKL